MAPQVPPRHPPPRRPWSSCSSRSQKGSPGPQHSQDCPTALRPEPLPAHGRSHGPRISSGGGGRPGSTHLIHCCPLLCTMCVPVSPSLVLQAGEPCPPTLTTRGSPLSRGAAHPPSSQGLQGTRAQHPHSHSQNVTQLPAPTIQGAFLWASYSPFPPSFHPSFLPWRVLASRAGTYVRVGFPESHLPTWIQSCFQV